MKCSVEGCQQESCGQPEGSDKYKLCLSHWHRWGDFHTGYQDGHYGNSERYGRLNKKLWDKAMLAFLEHCAIEIVAFAQIEEAIARIKELPA